MTLHLDRMGRARGSQTERQPRGVNLKVNDRVNVAVAVDLKVRVDVDVIVELRDPEPRAQIRNARKPAGANVPPCARSSKPIDSPRSRNLRGL
jgi:hypothetical protein